MNFFKRNWQEIVLVYLLLSICAWMPRIMVYNQPMDCAHRYMDYVFPISKLHCEIK